MGTLVNAENIRGVYYTEGKDVVAVDNVSIKIGRASCRERV